VATKTRTVRSPGVPEVQSPYRWVATKTDELSVVFLSLGGYENWRVQAPLDRMGAVTLSLGGYENWDGLSSALVLGAVTLSLGGYENRQATTSPRSRCSHPIVGWLRKLD